MIPGVNPQERKTLVEKWQPVLESYGDIKDEYVLQSTAQVLENTVTKGNDTSQAYMESYTGIVSSAGAMQAATPGAIGTTSDYGAGDGRIPNIVVPTLRRFFPELVAHELCGVQPMNGPLGFAFAIRAKYGVNGLGKAGGTDSLGTEIGYNNIDDRFTGTSGLLAEQLSGNYGATVPGVGTVDSSSEYWQAYAGSSALFDGKAAALGTAEWWKIGEDMPMVQFALEKGIVEAGSRKLASNWSLELTEDMMNMHGVNVDDEMFRIMAYEIKAEIDRHCLSEMVKAAIVGGSETLSTWSPVSADGRNQLERIATLYTQMTLKQQRVAYLTRRGAANKAIVSPTVAGLLNRLRDMAGYTYANNSGSSVNTGVDGTLAKIGRLEQSGMDVYRDTWAGGDYVLLGYKGAMPTDAGVIFCPYIPFQVLRATGTQSFDPRMGMRTRYGVLANLFGSSRYYQMIKVDGLTDAALAGDGSRVFTY